MEHLYPPFNADDLALILKNRLFASLESEKLLAFFRVIKPDLMEMEPNGHITVEPGHRRRFGVVLSGTVKVLAVDYSGNKTIVNALQNDGFIGTMQFMSDYYDLMLELVSDTPSKILMMNPDGLLHAVPGFEDVQHRILVNLLEIRRRVFVNLAEHLICLSQKSIRDKVLCYLQLRSETERSYEFDIPLSREELATYLAVDRASLSRTLSGLKRDGVLDYRKNHFRILSTKYFQYTGDWL